MSQPDLTAELREALDHGHGFVQGPSYVLMSLDVYREMLGATSDDDSSASVAALERSMAEARRGATRPLTDALDELGRQHEASR